MENWTIEALKILGGALAGVLLTEAFPAIKAFFKKGSLSLKNREKESLKIQYQWTKIYSKNHATLVARSIRQLTAIFNGLLVLGLFFFVDVVMGGDVSTATFYENPWVLSLILGFLSSKLNSVADNIDNAMNFVRYKEKTTERYKRLGGNPEDLDKEQTA